MGLKDFYPNLTDKDGFLINWQPPHYFVGCWCDDKAAVRCVWCKTAIYPDGTTQPSLTYLDEFRIGGCPDG